MSRIIAVTSGKGGVGKTHLSVNLALHCARAGLRTCVFDADLGLANVNLLLKLTPQLTLADVLAGRCHLRDIVQRAFGIEIIPGSSGMEHMADLSPVALARVADEFKTLGRYDLIFVDTAAGVADNVLAFVAAAPEVLLVITPEPTALTDAYALIKLLQRRRYSGRIQVVVNQAQSDRHARHTYEKFREVVRVYQGIDLPLLGAVPADASVAEAVGLQTPVSILQPDAGAGRALAELAARLLNTPAPVSDPARDPASSQDALNTFWTRLTGKSLGPRPETVAPVANDIPAPSPERMTAAGDMSAVTAARLAHIEAQLAQLTALLDLHVAAPSAGQASPLHTPPPRESADRSMSNIDTQPASHRRRAGEVPQASRSLRASSRATPIDALQLRRVVGRMLVKAMPGREPDAPAGAEPVQIAVDQLQLESDNEFSLRPGRYTRVSLHCAHIASPDRFIEEIFSTCAITGCKVRNLGSHVRYWLTSGRDGCILLDGAVGERNCVQVYMAAGGNTPLEAAGSELGATAPSESSVDIPPSIPTLRRTPRTSGQGVATPAQLLAKFPHERSDGGGEAGLTLYRLSRRDREPLLCAFNNSAGHDSAGEDVSGVLRERSP